MSDFEEDFDYHDDDDYNAPGYHDDDDYNAPGYHGQELSYGALDMLDDYQREEYEHRHDHHYKEGRIEVLNDRKQHTPIIQKAIELMKAKSSNNSSDAGNPGSGGGGGSGGGIQNARGLVKVKRCRARNSGGGGGSTDSTDSTDSSTDDDDDAIPGFESVNDRGLDGSTALIMAVTEGDVEGVRALLQVAGADPNQEAVEFNEDVDRRYAPGSNPAIHKKIPTPLLASCLIIFVFPSSFLNAKENGENNHTHGRNTTEKKGDLHKV